MREGWIRLAFSFCICLLAANSAWPAAPVIERVDLERIRGGHSTDLTWASDDFIILVSDADGVDDIASVAIGSWSFETNSTGGGFEWSRPGPDVMQLTVREFGYGSSDPYVITATDMSQAETTLSITPPVMPQPPPVMISPGGSYDYPILHQPEVTFTWSGTDPAADNRLTVSRTSKVQVWSYDAGASTSVAYNADGTAADAPLQAGFSYVWDFVSHKIVDDATSDSRVHTSSTEKLNGRFILYSAAPTIEAVDIWLLADSTDNSLVSYGQGVTVEVTDCIGHDDLESVTVTDPAGAVYVINSSDYRFWQAIDQYTLLAVLPCFRPLPDREPPVAGAYTVTVADAAGLTATLTMPETQAIPAPQVTAPPDGSVIYDLKPTFRWDVGVSSTQAELWVAEEAAQEWLWHVWDAPGAEAPFNYNGTAQRAELAPGHTYVWTAWTTTLQPDVADSRVRIWADQVLRGRFTEYETWPVLPRLGGKLAFGMYLYDANYGEPFARDVGVLLYQPDPTLREWLGPLDREHPDWSPDGTKLAYEGWELCVDSLDGSPPAQLTEFYASDPHWSPDGNRIVFAGPGGYPGDEDIWIINADGSDAHAVVQDTDGERYPTWSPDGQWIAYRREFYGGDCALWLAHPDGSENHALPVTGVAGYPDYETDYMGANGWAPDGQRLVAEFNASLPDHSRPDISGIGVISRGGGLLRPIFLTPSGVACCPAPKLPTWSPDGTRIVFTSGHHLPFNPQWVNGEFEPGDELWMINADGSGEPSRLTYDYSFNGTSSWWGPDLFPDVPKGSWAYCAISTCQEAGIVGGYQDGSYQPGWPVTRDQMAVYISRAMAGGDANVPSGPATATFSDVPTGYWAYRYVEYAVSRGLVQGYDPTHYLPEVVVDRGQMAVFVSRSQGWVKLGDDMTTAPQLFPDVPAGFWAGTAIQACVDNSVVHGYDDGTYRPAEQVTRDQMAVYIARAFQLPM